MNASTRYAIKSSADAGVKELPERAGSAQRPVQDGESAGSR
jgi:hypothetical protein